MKALLTFVAAFLACSAAAQAWIPRECPNRFEQTRAEFARLMREAKPGSPIFAPKPYPVDDAQVIEDFEYAYFFMWKGVKIPKDELPLYQAVQSGSVKYRIRRVENWSPNRCDPRQQRDHLFLLDLFGTADDRHIARATLTQPGFLGAWFLMASPAHSKLLEEALPALAQAVRQVREGFGVNASSPQYVTTWGLRCADYAPCMAFRSADRVYLLHQGELFQFGPASKVRKQRPPGLGSLSRAELAENEALISLGRAHWVVARKVPRSR